MERLVSADYGSRALAGLEKVTSYVETGLAGRVCGKELQATFRCESGLQPTATEGMGPHSHNRKGCILPATAIRLETDHEQKQLSPQTRKLARQTP